MRAAMEREDAVEGTTTANEWRSLKVHAMHLAQHAVHPHETVHCFAAPQPTSSADHVGRDSTPHALLIDYADGLRGTVLRIGDDNARWNFACRIAGEPEPRSTRVVVGPWRNRYCFKAFANAIQQFCQTGSAPYPVERTLLVTGIL